MSKMFTLSCIAVLAASGLARAVDFERIVIDDDFPGAYQVEVADVNGDKKPDVIAVGGGTCAWYENPTWKKRIVTTSKQTPGIISSATADLDGDGKAEFAIAYEFSMNQPTKGKLLVAKQGKTPDEPCTTTHVADVGSIHRLRWFVHTSRIQGAADANGRPGPLVETKSRDLIVAPIFGPSAKPPAFQEEPAHLVRFIARHPHLQKGGFGRNLNSGVPGVLPKGIVPGFRRSDPPLLDFLSEDPKTGLRIPGEIGDAPVMHAIDVVDVRGSGTPTILAASNSGVTRFDLSISVGGFFVFEAANLVSGAPGTAPKKGASEVHTGTLKDKRRFLATVEPWHGTDVAVYLSETPGLDKLGPRNVIDASLKEGHALWVADVDGDGDDEIFAGYRGKGTSVLMYDFNGKGWDRTVVDPAIAAQDLRGGDINGDGVPDVVAVGGATHNVVWYRPIRKPR